MLSGLLFPVCEQFNVAVAPKIDRRNLFNLTVKEGEPIYLDVKVSGEPAPDVSWYQDNKTVIPTGHRRIEDVPYNSKFFNDKPERKDTGVYKIVAVNKYGQDTAEIEITVVCKYDYSLSEEKCTTLPLQLNLVSLKGH